MSSDDFDAAHGPDESASASEESAAALLAFWEVARVRAGVVRVGVVTGPGVSGTMTPPAWAFGDTPQVADALLDLVLDGTKTATSGALVEYTHADAPLPVKGDLSIVLDGEGRPGALIRTTAVGTVPLGEVDEAHALAEGEGDRTLQTWRRDHEAYWAEVLAPLGEPVTPDLAVVTEQFELLYPRLSDR